MKMTEHVFKRKQIPTLRQRSTLRQRKQIPTLRQRPTTLPRSLQIGMQIGSLLFDCFELRV